MLKTIEWTGHAVRLLDQTRLPTETVYVDITDEKQMHDAIQRLVVRGAPAIGIAAAFGAYLGARNHTDRGPDLFFKRLNEVCQHLAGSRPTAVNLTWALNRVQRVARELAGEFGESPACHLVRDVADSILNECLKMLDEDTRACRAIGRHGLNLLDELIPRSPQPDAPVNILTHCNAGGLATAQYGTALAPIYVGAEQGRRFHVFVDETRPLLQGSRITAYELLANNISATLICDNMAATVMSQRRVDAVIVGADRIAANGDVANKIGTLGVAILARHFGIPFLVAAPTSSIDLAIPDGSHIPIEQRNPREVTDAFGRPTAPPGVQVYNPAFDVTPADLVTAIITEHGVVRPPFASGIQHVVNQRESSWDRPALL